MFYWRDLNTRYVNLSERDDIISQRAIQKHVARATRTTAGANNNSFAKKVMTTPEIDEVIDVSGVQYRIASIVFHRGVSPNRGFK